MFDDPSAVVREAVLSSGKGRMYRTEKWALLDYGKDGELYDMERDPQQYTNLFDDPDYAEVLAGMKQGLAEKIQVIENNDLGRTR